MILEQTPDFLFLRLKENTPQPQGSEVDGIPLGFALAHLKHLTLDMNYLPSDTVQKPTESSILILFN